MGKIYCCVTGCSNFRGKLIDEERTVSLHRFPANAKLCRIWVQRVKCTRKNFTLGKHSRMCSEHFKDRKGPSKDYPVPNLFPHKVFKTFKISDSELTIEPEPEEEQTENGQESDIEDENNNMCTGTSLLLNCSMSSLNASLLMHDYGGTIPQDSLPCKVDKCEQTESVQILSDSIKSLDTGTLVHKVTHDIGIQCKLPDTVLEDIENSDEDVAFFTGFPSFVTLMLVFNTLKARASNMSYWKGQNSAGEKEYQKKRKIETRTSKKIKTNR